MKKKLCAILSTLLLLTMLVPMACFADYSTTIPLTATGNSDTVIYIKRPESLSASTSDRTYTISAVGPQGTTIKLYKYDAAEDICKLIKKEIQIGASGLYSTVVELDADQNVFVVYAQNGLADQVTRIDISKIKRSTVDRLKSVTVTMKNFIS